MSLDPFFRSYFTDLSAYIINAQGTSIKLCRDLESRTIDCLEAYGLDKGRIKCKDLMDDFAECTLRRKQTQRLVAMRTERHKQYYLGDKKEHYAEPPQRDSV